jgi:hypothetical protein
MSKTFWVKIENNRSITAVRAGELLVMLSGCHGFDVSL